MSSSETDPRATAPQRRLYGRRRGRPLRVGQRVLFETLLPQLRLTLPESGAVLDPRSLFDKPIREVWLEIGFGAGEHLAFHAGANPDCGLIGSEVFEPGIAHLLTEVKERELANVRLFIDDARLVIAALAPKSLGRAFILHPDPWPKERHKKRRIVSRETLDHLATALCDGAELRIATDDPDYGEWIAERVAVHPDFAPLPVDPRPADWPPTRYELKAKAQGRAARRFSLRRRPR
ncbi:MAG TPA: tRNA (guanine(46)-N(7))-methyltransferase TrmB [Stellaceae bacterium]|jgi:tRNA (guanine-N7-)-methyltransferase|nr:tRNA (guanine(46)-N(7))-methyltransferase TrmB [Stellaceae bacterium]